MNRRNRTWSLAVLGLILLTILSLLAASCGGGASSVLPSGETTTTPATTGSHDTRALPLGSALPAIPLDLGVADARGVSEVGERSFTGSGDALLNYAGGVVDGDSLVLTSTTDEIAWAFYRAEGLRDLWVTNLGIMTVPGDMNTTWYGGLGNFSLGAWDWLIETKLPEVNFDLTENIDRIVSPLGNMYWVVVVPAGGYTLEIQQAKLLVDEYNGGWRPGEGNFLFASIGLPGVIQLQWGFIDGADFFEIYRRAAPDPAGVFDGEFELVAITPDPFYEDFDVVPYLPYEYQVRAINPMGAGAFSNTAVGWAEDPNGGGDPGWDDASGFGQITAYTQDSLTLAVEGYDREEWVYALNADTVYFDCQGAPVAWDYFDAGMTVFVEGEFDADGNRIARAVQEACPPGNEPPPAPAYMGTVLELTEGVLTINTDWDLQVVSFGWDVDTLWVDVDGQVLDPTDFAVGDFVWVMTGPENPMQLYAEVVQKLPRQPDGGDPGDGNPPPPPEDPGDPANGGGMR